MNNHVILRQSTIDFVPTQFLILLMPWPTPVLRQFQLIPHVPSEHHFHGPYNKLLATLFSANSDYTVVPQFMPNEHE
jgi:hypothetical protein